MAQQNSTPALALTRGDMNNPAAKASRVEGAAVRFLDRPEGRIAYDDRGTGPLVVMMPGLGDLRQEYRFLAPRLIAAGYRVVTMDLRGHGQSSTGWRDHAAPALGEDALALIRHLAAGPAFLMGTSMGAGAIAWAAAEAPDLVDGLVVIGPFVRDIRPASAIAAAVMPVLLRAAFGGPWAAFLWGKYYGSLYPTRQPDDFESYRADLVANLRQPGRMVAAKAMMFASKAEVERRLPEVSAPTLVLMGSKDPDFPDPEAEARHVAQLLRGEYAMIAGAGHYPHAEMPDETAPHIIRFLESQRDR